MLRSHRTHLAGFKRSEVSWVEEHQWIYKLCQCHLFRTPFPLFSHPSPPLKQSLCLSISVTISSPKDMRKGGSNAAAQPNYADGGRQLKAGRLLASRKVPLLSSERTLSIEISICLLCQMGPLGPIYSLRQHQNHQRKCLSNVQSKLLSWFNLINLKCCDIQMNKSICM